MLNHASNRFPELETESVEIAARRRHDIVSRGDRLLARLLPVNRTPLRLKAPLVSFTFDDVPDSAASTGAGILERHGVRGTFYVSGGLAGKRHEPWTFAAPGALRALVEAGHEIGCHTYSHPDLQWMGRAEIDGELSRNLEFFVDHHVETELENFAYPYGSVGVLQKLRIAPRFGSCRSVHEDVNSSSLDLGHLSAVRLYDDVLGQDGLERWLDETVTRRGWLIFYTHDVADPRSSQGTSSRLLEDAVRQSLARNCQVVTVAQALRVAGVERNRPNRDRVG